MIGPRWQNTHRAIESVGYAALVVALTVLNGCGRGDADQGAGGSGDTEGHGSNGTSPSGGSGGSAASTGTSYGSGGFHVPTCAADANFALPDNAPELAPHVWTNVGPADVPFGTVGEVDTVAVGVALDPCNPATIYLSVASPDEQSQTGVFRSVDAGTTWSRVGDVQNPNHTLVDPTDPLHLYAGSGVGGVNGFFVSHDGGQTWTMPKGFADAHLLVGLDSGGGMYDVYDVAADPTDFEHVLVSFHSPWTWGDSAAGAGVLESKDGGETWKAHHWPSPEWGYGHAINFLFDPVKGIGDSGTWLLGTQGNGMWRTADGGETWSQVTEASIFHGGGTVYYGSNGTVYASAAEQNLKSTDNGKSWTPIGPGGGYTALIGDGKRLYTALAFNPSSFMVASEDDDTKWAALDGGSQSFAQGPFEMAYDPHNRILYASNWVSGLWAIHLP
jgi:photosystem II stability/assembly factor-like uncharacterized protein